MPSDLETMSTASAPVVGSSATVVRGRDAPVLYLDFDSVLHRGGAFVHCRLGVQAASPGATLFEFAPLLAEDMRPFPDVLIVLATSWQLWRGYESTRARLPQELQPRVVGGTFHRQHHTRELWWSTPRGLQIWHDVQRRRPRAWVAVDDDDYGWPAWCRDRLVRTEDSSGYSDPAVRAQLRQQLALISA